MLKYDRMRGISWRMICACCVCTLLFASLMRMDVIVDVIREKRPLEAGWTEAFIQDTLYGDGMLFLLPLLCAIPYAASFTEEYSSGLARFAVARTGKKPYIKSKLMTVWLSGGLTVGCGALVIISASLAAFLPMEQNQDAYINPALAALLCRFFCFGGLGAVTGLYVSAKVQNRYMAWTAPFMAEYLLLILCERYIPACVVLSPKEWLNPSEGWPLAGWSSVIWMLCLTGFAALHFWKTAVKKLEDM